ncbi:hypothetical protein ETD86_25600 [Nonomuraea turkmeniaca]|uniref:Uncharacterized protein n=1 Tax=Nonomuraea turkmeniaca TaxID=103838 RepID=A0A5S4FD24_9ACTN|nr:hypothetical protein [Nonomuraea turkmeniaca]TMR16293.1 hypothetical protein ETD86_25600 [Nonomuraea turkmeniaca]
MAAAVQMCDQAATVVSRLAWRERAFAVVEPRRQAPQPAVREPVNGFLGVDQGVANLAVTNDGAVLPGPIHGTAGIAFLRTGCGLAGHADRIAARNIAVRGVAGRAAVNQSHATGLPSARRDRESKALASIGGG